MKPNIIAFGSALLLLTGLGGCVAEPGYYGGVAPYYGGAAPYYGTAYIPAYAYGYAYGTQHGYYPYHHSTNIYSGYNKSYWHYQHGSQPGGSPAHGGPHEGGHH